MIVGYLILAKTIFHDIAVCIQARYQGAGRECETWSSAKGLDDGCGIAVCQCRME